MDKVVFDFLYSAVMYNNFGHCLFLYSTFEFLPLSKISLRLEDKEIIESKQYDNIEHEIDIVFGVALDDDNTLAMTIKLRYFPNVKHWGIKLFEI